MIKKSVAIFLVIIFLLLSVVKNTVLAQSETPPFPQTATNSASEQKEATKVATLSEFGRQYIGKVTGLISILHIASCVIVGEKCLGDRALSEGKQIPVPPELEKNRPFYKDGLLGVVDNLMIVTYTYPPASLSYSLLQAWQNISPIGKAYAQSSGLGMSALAAFSSFWSINRNIAYSLIIIVLAITGFLLIFRYKIDPNTSIDLEKVMIKTVLVILTITFSYTIAGFLIDLMYLSLLMVFTVAKQNNLVNAQIIESLYGHVTPEEIFRYITVQSDPNVLANNLLTLVPNNIHVITNGLLTSIITLQNYPLVASALRSIATIFEASAGISLIGSGSVEFDPGAFLASFIALPVAAMLSGVIANWLVQFVIFIAVSLTLLFLYFKILFMLIGSYIEIVFEVIFAPYILLFDIFPGKNYFGVWLKRLLAAIITFPLLAILFLAGANLSQAIAGSSTAFLPPPLAGISQTVMASLVGIGILIAIPAMIDRVKRWIIPEHTLVNFPSTPAALIGTAASIIPFVPFISGIAGSLSAFRSSRGAKEEPTKSSLAEEMPHLMPHNK